jgi:hypothetical protein
MRTRRELKAMFPDPKMRELIDSLWREIHDNNVIEDVFQLAHGFEPGEAVKIDQQSGLWVRSLANQLENAGTIGIICRINDQDSFNIRIGGLLVGEYELGAIYFLSPFSLGKLFIQSDPEVWEMGNVREFIGTGVEGGLMIELDCGQEITDDVFDDKYLTQMLYDTQTRVLTLKRSFGLPDLFVTIPFGVTLAAVATSGNYSDLNGKPSLFSGIYNDLSGLPNLNKAFTDLTDVIPENYLGRKNSIPMVVEQEDKLDLIETEILETEAARFVLNADCPQSYTGMGGYFVRVKSDETGLEFIAP